MPKPFIRTAIIKQADNRGVVVISLRERCIAGLLPLVVLLLGLLSPLNPLLALPVFYGLCRFADCRLAAANTLHLSDFLLTLVLVFMLLMLGLTVSPLAQQYDNLLSLLAAAIALLGVLGFSIAGFAGRLLAVPLTLRLVRRLV
ncbi:hypothetical protein [Bacterioplanoides pacificum]|uniref:Uncharacterized protein n=1 Tax=Bacterioplanoides pacificum TaxID=1171596 RepID=A0ABV7VXL3_9GAMM